MLKNKLSNLVFVLMMILICGWFCRSLFFNNVRAYGARTTHAALTEKAVDLYNHFYHQNISQEYLREMVTGVVNEDTPPRWINHFYDPTTGNGWTGERMGQLPASVIRQLALLGLSFEKAVSALEWAHNQVLQDSYLSYEGNRTFEKAVYDYIKGDKKNAYRSLGHLLHLIQDMTVPAHTRQDTHFEALGDPGEPYEKWASDNGDLSRLTDDYLAQSDFRCADIDDCFKKIAQYSNENFFSEGTIFDKDYNKIDFNLINEGNFWYGVKNNIYLFRGEEKEGIKGLINITLQDDKINQSYWNRLSEKAVLSSVEVIRLFHEYVAKAQNNPALIEKPPVSSSMFFLKMMTGLPGILAPAVEPPVFSLYGSIIQVGKAAAGIFNKITTLFGNNQESFQADIIDLLQADVEDTANAQPNEVEPKLAVDISPIPKKADLKTEDSVTAKEPIPAVNSIPNAANLEPIPNAPLEKDSSSSSVAANTNQQMLATPPSGFGFFIGGGTPSLVEPVKTELATTSEAKFESEPALMPEPILPETVFVSAPHIITADGQVFELADDIATSSNGVQINLMGTSTPDLPVFISVNSSSTVQTYLILTDNNGDWSQVITLGEGINGITAKARDASGNESGEISVSLFLNIISPSQIANHIIINEVQLRDNEFVELYNPTNENIDMSDWYFSYYPYQHDWDNPYRSKKFPTGAVIPSNGYYLIGLDGYSNIEKYNNLADWQPYSSNLLNNEKGSIAIFPWNPNGKDIGELKNNYIDALGWGEANYVYETAPVVDAPNINESLTRAPNYWDTDNNKNDFQINNQPLPVNSNHETRTIIPDSTIITEDTVWVAERSPYVLESNFTVSPIVANGAVLTIEPGVVIKGANKYYPSLIVKGTLKAQGASDNMITFTVNGDNPQAGDWSGVIFDNTSGASVLENVVFEYGGYQTNYNGNNIEEMIHSSNSQLTLNNVAIRYSANSGIYLNSTANISNSNFADNNSNGIIIDGAVNQSIVDNCQFISNSSGILITGQSSPVISNDIFSNNIYPIYLISAYPDFQNNQASVNTINGILVDQNSQFTQNTVWRNDLAYVLQAGFNDYPAVAVGAVLTIEPGTVIKPYNRHYTILKVEGSLIMQGAADNLIVVTSLNDDLYKGDTDNGDAGASSWKNIDFAAGSGGKIDQVLFKNSETPTLIIDANALVDVGSVYYEL